VSLTYKPYYSKIKEIVYPILRENPFFGANIKRLKGKLASIYRFRIGNFRLFYTIDSERKLVFILDIENRKDAHR
jgi:mRNA interferase RelE/StbE